MLYIYIYKYTYIKEWFLARDYPEIVVNNQIDKVVFGRETSLLRKNWKVAFLSLLPITQRLKSLEKLLGTYFLFYTVMVKLKGFSHLPRSYLTEVQEN